MRLVMWFPLYLFLVIDRLIILMIQRFKLPTTQRLIIFLTIQRPIIVLITWWLLVIVALAPDLQSCHRGFVGVLDSVRRHLYYRLIDHGLKLGICVFQHGRGASSDLGVGFQAKPRA